jgi:hypothetical protein
MRQFVKRIGHKMRSGEGDSNPRSGFLETRHWAKDEPLGSSLGRMPDRSDHRQWLV